MARPWIEPRYPWLPAIAEGKREEFMSCRKALVYIGLVGRVYANGPGDRGSIAGRVIPRT